MQMAQRNWVMNFKETFRTVMKKKILGIEMTTLILPHITVGSKHCFCTGRYVI